MKRNTEGPGLKPPMVLAARMMNTAEMLPGMPRLRAGIRLAPDTAEFAASQAAMPSGAPSPKRGSPRCILRPAV